MCRTRCVFLTTTNELNESNPNRQEEKNLNTGQDETQSLQHVWAHCGLCYTYFWYVFNS